jgi:phosphatidylethanolamine-binding protein (PEBP) family uncharacterized protein
MAFLGAFSLFSFSSFAGAKKKDLEKAMKRHVLAQGQLVGRYQR